MYFPWCSYYFKLQKDFDKHSILKGIQRLVLMDDLNFTEHSGSKKF